MDSEENPYRILERTRRAEVNYGAYICSGYLKKWVMDALEASELLSKCNFDAREQTREGSIELLLQTIKIAKATKDKYLKVRRELDNLIFNLDWFIRRCDQDLKRFRG